MKLYFTLFFSAAIVAILGGCNQQPAPATRHTPKYTVDIANKQYSEKAALQVVDAIKLQTTKKSLINQIAKIIKYGDYLFILTQVPQNNILQNRRYISHKNYKRPCKQRGDLSDRHINR